MRIVDSFLPFLQVFYLTMTMPTGHAFIELVSGWLFAPGRSLADRIRAIDSPRVSDTYYRVLRTASWSIDAVGLRLIRMILRWAPQETLVLVGDDTLLPRKGAKVYGAGMHRDGCLSTRSRAVKRWGHSWVVLSVLWESRRYPGRYHALPVMMRLYLNQATAAKLERTHRKKTDLMLDMVRRIERELPQQKLHFLGDYGYTAPAVLHQFSRTVEVTGRAHPKARLYAPAPPRRKGRGRPRIHGEQLPSAHELLEGRAKRREFEVAPGRRYRVRAASIQGCFFQAPNRLLHVVALEHLTGRRENEVFYSTVADASVEQIVCWYSRRWSIEVTFRDSKQHLAVGREQNRARDAARRTAPIGFLMYSLVVLWHENVKPEVMTGLREYPGKRQPSFADMLAALRRDTLRQHCRNNFQTPTSTADLQKNYSYLEKLLLLAA